MCLLNKTPTCAIYKNSGLIILCSFSFQNYRTEIVPYCQCMGKFDIHLHETLLGLCTIYSRYNKSKSYKYFYSPCRIKNHHAKPYIPSKSLFQFLLWVHTSLWHFNSMFGSSHRTTSQILEQNRRSWFLICNINIPNSKFILYMWYHCLYVLLLDKL